MPALVAAPSSLTVAKTLAPHLLSLTLPLTALGFLLTGTHPFYAALPWLFVVVLAILIDNRSPADRRAPVPGLPALPFDLLLAVLAALQIANIALLGRLIAVSGLFSADALVAVLLVGMNTGYSAIVVAHELTHRRSRAAQFVGRVLMMTALYEHFSTEHIRGHHARLGTSDDPATARYDETFGAFLVRTVPAQFRSAWAIERARVGGSIAQNRVVQGIAAEVVIGASMLAFAGPAALAVFVLQAAVAVCLLEAVNYFEHWGIVRAGKKVRPVDSWDTESWFTLHALVGLSHHADHHAYAARPYQELRTWDESPKLPRGYLGMVVLVIGRNRECRRLLREELARVGLRSVAGQPVSSFAG